MPRRVAVARLSAVLLLVVAGVLGTAQVADAAPTPADLTYLNSAHQINLMIIQAGQGAKANGKSACVRRVGAQLETDHRRLAAQELEAARRLAVGLVPIPSQEQREQLDAVVAKAGTSGYDAAWLALQRQAHRQYLALTKDELAKGSDPAVKSVASGAQAVIEMHLHMVGGPCRVGSDTPTVPTGDGGQMADAQRVRSRTGLALFALGVLLLAGKAIRLKRRLIGLSAMAIGLGLVFGGPLGDAGKVPDAGRPVADPEAAIPPARLALAGVVNASVVPVATGGDGQLQVPKSPTSVGWWAAGAAPGSASGTVLLVGHVDSVGHAKAVFAPLWDIPVGAKVAVTGGDGRVHRYRIVSRRTYQQDDLPSDLFRGAAKPRLALVTCVGAYDHAAHRYTHNLVLYGVPT